MVLVKANVAAAYSHFFFNTRPLSQQGCRGYSGLGPGTLLHLSNVNIEWPEHWALDDDREALGKLSDFQ
ncbi:hypothetical protein ACFL27_16315 [candidate division CSSED10-310 bacterium]|uniref:ASPIC/UnbV domain-containing protein n=1 Tax=candidate division CSSED10-310 bacterium TaxID=2855610 RepID=A0ABV6YZX2_UNCC1